MFRFLRRALARPEFDTGDERLAAPSATLLRFPSQPKDSPGDIVMTNGRWAPVPWATLPGAGYSFVRAWPISDRPPRGITGTLVMERLEVEQAACPDNAANDR